MLDSAFGIFNNVSPRFQWAEIDLTFPSDDRFFAVAKYDELVAHSLFPVGKMKIKDAFLILFSLPDKAEEGLTFLRRGNLTALDMQMLIHCTFCHFLLCHLTLTATSYIYAYMGIHLLKSSRPLTIYQHQCPGSTFQNGNAKLEDRLGRNQGRGRRE
jgi:hypothetical protein